eukprot:TRINITY_DN10354_c0_g1_i6.p1 TRINITY_DN10354_c0_g1~~TRINITY_DN10354_c0_g1_i6.p1  ORF type:complete len:308 (+),score=90.03 TRINITY_DN10354_c0_g1_i6:576-1499(+)
MNHLLRRAVRARSATSVLPAAPERASVMWASDGVDARMVAEDEEESTREERMRRRMHAENKDAPVLLGSAPDEEEQDEDEEEDDDGGEDIKLRAMLYQRFLIKCQQLQTLIFLVGGAIFTVGSVLFLPQADDWFNYKGQPEQEAIRLTHGCWLFLSGSVVFMIGAYLGKKIGFELMLTGKPLRYNFWRGKHYHHLYWWSDERVNLISCNILMIGTGMYVFGTLGFFPGWPDTSEILGYTACTLFILGSVCFVLSAVLDYLRLRRTHSKYTQFDVEHEYDFTEAAEINGDLQANADVTEEEVSQYHKF